MNNCDNEDVLERIRSALRSSTDREERKKLEEAERLITLSRSYEQMEDFRVGDLVKWKPGMRNTRNPQYSQVAIVSAVYDCPQLNTDKSAGSSFFREPATIKIAIIDSTDDEFIEYSVDGHRFMKVDEDECVPRKVADLRTRLQTLLTEEGPFHVGDRVYWKPNLKHKKRPQREPAIIMEILPQPILDECESGSQYWHEPLNIRVGMRDSDGEFISYLFDSRRFHVIDDDDESYGEANANGLD